MTARSLGSSVSSWKHVWEELGAGMDCGEYGEAAAPFIGRGRPWVGESIGGHWWEPFNPLCIGFNCGEEKWRERKRWGGGAGSVLWVEGWRRCTERRAPPRWLVAWGRWRRYLGVTGGGRQGSWAEWASRGHVGCGQSGSTSSGDEVKEMGRDHGLAKTKEEG
jgi:hypothetical protein